MNSEPKADETKAATIPETEATASATTAATGGAAGATAHASAYVDPSFALEAKVAAQDAQIKDLTDRLLRAHAEMDNIRKRTEREKADTIKYAITKFANDIVGMGDNFQRAISAVPAGAADADPALKSLLDGVMLTEREFLSVLERHGVKRIDPLGESFNPNVHQAVMEQPNADVPAGTVLQVFQPGYVIEDRILRPAMVVVSKGGFKPMKPVDAMPDAAPAPANGAITPEGDANDGDANAGKGPTTE
jgi:molecular chaperone GrpE